MTAEKIPAIETQARTLFLAFLTAVIFLGMLASFPKMPVAPAMVFKPVEPLSAALDHGIDAATEPTIAAALHQPVPLPRAKWQSPPVLLPGMVPFRGKKGDETFDRFILDAAERYAMDPAVIKAVIMAESGFNPRAVSRAGAQGLMQLMPRTAGSLGVENAFDPQANILAGTRYLKKLLQRFDGNLELALAAYNAGTRNVLKHNGIPPFKTTRRYIDKIKIYYQHYRDQAFWMFSSHYRRTLSPLSLHG